VHTHAHGHGHQHDHGRATSRRKLAWTLLLIVGYMVAEVVGGLLSGSLALLADAGHMFSDAAALSLALFAIWIAQRPPTPERTYGYYRIEVLAALVNGAALLTLAVLVIREAWLRLNAPGEVAGEMMLGVALGGLVVNLLALWILHGNHQQSVNVRGAWLHVLSDTLGSVGAVAGGLAVWKLGWMWADPAVSVLIALLVIASGWALLKEVVHVLMEGTPAHIDLPQVRAELASAPGVLDVHDLHVWTITTGLDALSGHVVVEDDRPCGELLRELRRRMHERFGIDHVTIQIEPRGFEESRRLQI
jgi:cobalt-zinc-cadmium efflux system protein